MKQLKVNPLPSRTWRWLRMNESALTCEIPDQSCFGTLTGADALVWNSEPAPAEIMETGMGQEFTAAMSGAPAASLTAAAGVVPEQTAVLTCGAGAGVLSLHAGEDSVLPLTILLNGGNDTALQILIHAEKRAVIRLCLVQLQQQGLSMTDIGGICEDNAGLELVQLSLGADHAFAGIAVALQGEESYLQTDYGYRVKTGQKLDINYVARHMGRESTSTMNAWAVMEEGAWKLFRGTIDFMNGCAGAKGAEKEEVLLLGEKQVNQTIPLILCQEEDVEGDHGATISRLDEQVKFYLGSRGISPVLAEEMIARARLEAICAMVPDAEVRRLAEEFILPVDEGERFDEEL